MGSLALVPKLFNVFDDAVLGVLHSDLLGFDLEFKQLNAVMHEFDLLLEVEELLLHKP